MSSNENVNEAKDLRDRHDHHHRHWRHRRKFFFLIPFGFAAFVALKSAVVLFLWNKLVPDVFHGPVLTYLQAIELTVLAKILVGFGHGAPRGPFGRHRGRHHLWHERMAALSPEEREKLREAIRHRCER